MSSSDSESISSSSSSSSDEIGSSLSASQWNRQRSDLGVRPVKRSDLDDDHNTALPHPNLLKGRYHAGKTSVTPSDTGLPDNNVHTELETFVLQDCLSNHFLTSHLPHEEIERLCKSFEKVHFRDHEVIYSIGDESKYLFILYSGDVLRRPEVINDETDSTEKYTVLGELSVLTGSVCQETAKALSNCTFFRIQRDTLHRFLRPVPEINTDQKVSLLKAAIPDEVMDFINETDLQELASALCVHRFQKGDILVHKRDKLECLVIIAQGAAASTIRALGKREYESQTFGPECSLISFGWQSILEGVQSTHFHSTIIAQTDGVTLMLPKSEFQRVLGSHDDSAVNLEQLAARRLARLELQSIPIFQDSMLDEKQVNLLIDLMHRCEYGISDTIIFRSGEKVEPALYFVREGEVALEMNKGADVKLVPAGDYFGEQNMLRDQNKSAKKQYLIRPPMTAIAHGKTVLDILYLEELRSVIDTTTIGLGSFDNKLDVTSIKLSNIERHALLGSGSFGQVWLASINVDSARQTAAFKVQSKHQILESGKAERIVAERNILASMKSPFLLRLSSSFQDDSRLYLITSLLQGGELESLVPDTGMPERSAKFYAAGILEGLAYMHRRHVIHRDIKTANILLNEKGYPVIIDFGFAKYCPDRTYTFVGSPIYTAPEICRFQGYGASVDYWAWGVLVYRLVTGRYPFFVEGGNELALYKRICRGSLELDGLMTMEFRMLMTRLLYPDPSKRLGSARDGWNEIVSVPWFSNDSAVDIRKLRRQKLKAPWVPELRDELDTSSFHPDESEIEDLMEQTFPAVEDEQQEVFAPFGPCIDDD